MLSHTVYARGKTGMRESRERETLLGRAQQFLGGGA